MPPLSEQTKARIDALPRSELQREINLGRRSRFQRESYSYLETRLAQIDVVDAAEQRSQDVMHRETEISLVEEANELSKGANYLSKIAIIVSVVSLLVAFVAISN